MNLWILSAALAADAWTATCPTKDDPSVYFIFTAAADAPPSPDFDCKGLFFEGMSCMQTVGIGKIKANGLSPGGLPVFELRYLPFGDMTSIVAFLNKPDGGVLYKRPPVAATTYAGTPPPPTPTELFKLYLDQRNKASAATKGITLHTWTCPDAQFYPPEESITPFGMTLSEHLGRSPLK